MVIKNKKFCLTFAGAPGSSKTPIAHFLSANLNLPIFSNDAIRKEVMEETGLWKEPQIGAYKKRRDQRLQKLINQGLPFIYDASMDRNWENLRPRLKKAGYPWFIISLDLSKKFLNKLYKIKFYTQPLGPSIKQHELFLKQFGAEISLHITDKNFKRRLSLSLKKAKGWVKKL